MKSLKIGALAKRAGVSVRTLHYYEEIGLLTPARRTDAGHREYGRQSVERLQQIKSLQHLGFSLAEVDALLRGGDVSPRRIVADQLAELQTRREAIDQLETRLTRLAQFLEVGTTDDDEAVELFLTTVEAMIMYEKYLTPEQLETVNQHHEAAPQSAQAAWDQALKGLRGEMEAGTEPADPKVQALLLQWHDSASAFMPGDDEAIHAGIMNMLHEEPEALEAHGLDAPLFAYIGQAAAPGEHPA